MSEFITLFVADYEPQFVQVLSPKVDPEFKPEAKTYTAMFRSTEFCNLARSEGNGEMVPQTSLLEAISDLPPLVLMKMLDSKDRFEHWYSSKHFHQGLYFSLRAFFSGKASPLAEFDDPKQKHRIELRRDGYIALYAVLHDGWQFIEPELAKHQLPLETPSETLIEILTVECIGYLSLVFPNIAPVPNTVVTFSPQKIYKIKSQIQNCQRLGKQPSPAMLKQYHQHLGWGAQWAFQLRDVCVAAVEKHAKKKGTTLRRKLIEYKKLEADFWELEFAKGHPSRKAQGFQWIDGKKYQGKKLGGTYVS